MVTLNDTLIRIFSHDHLIYRINQVCNHDQVKTRVFSSFDFVLKIQEKDRDILNNRILIKIKLPIESKIKGIAIFLLVGFSNVIWSILFDQILQPIYIKNYPVQVDSEFSFSFSDDCHFISLHWESKSPLKPTVRKPFGVTPVQQLEPPFIKKHYLIYKGFVQTTYSSLKFDYYFVTQFYTIFDYSLC